MKAQPQSDYPGESVGSNYSGVYRHAKSRWRRTVSNSARHRTFSKVSTIELCSVGAGFSGGRHIVQNHASRRARINSVGADANFVPNTIGQVLCR